MSILEELEKNGLFVGNKLLSNRDMVLATFYALITTTRNYQLLLTNNGNIGTAYVMQGQRFYGANKEYEQFINIKQEDLFNEQQPDRKKTANTNEEAKLSSYNCCMAIKLAQINKLIEGFENNPKYYIEWEGKRAANGGCWVFGAQELINNIKKMLR